jgi:hypothetical protein
MSYLYFSTWIVTEHLRLWNELTGLGWPWWSRRDEAPERWAPAAPASVPTPPSHGRGLTRDHPPDAYFERLMKSAERIAGHASYPGKQQAVDQCAEDVKDLIASGRISADQGAILLDILSACPQFA